MGSARIPAQPSGPGHFRSASLTDPNSWPPDPGSPAARQPAPPPPRGIDSSNILDILRAETWDQLKWLALVALGPASHNLGVCYGLAEGGWGIITGLLDLLKMLVLEGLYEEAHMPWSWWDLNSVESHFEGQLADRLLHSQLETAHQQYDALKAQFALVLKHPGQFFGGIWNAEVQEYTEKWEHYKWLLGHRTLANEFEAGRIEGQVLLEVILLLATVVDGVGLALKGAKALGEIPELVRLAKTVRSVKEARALLAARRLERLRAGALGEGESAASHAPHERAPGEPESKPPAPPLKPSYIHGQSDGGPGEWGPPSTPRNQLGTAYQQQVTGAPPGTEYKVPLDTRSSGYVDFDGYDPQRNVLLDAKDFSKWPPDGPPFLRDQAVKDIVKQAGDQLAAADGTPVEWHVPTQAKADELSGILSKQGLDDIQLVVTPKQ